jgi:parallel beta-helix repeat protein
MVKVLVSVFILASASALDILAVDVLKVSAQRLNNPIIYVNPVTGNDVTGKGTLQSPLRSLTNALEQAKFPLTIRLAPGTYTTANGEIFPILLKSGITIQGNESKQGADTVILGGGEFLSPTLTSQNITVLGADRAELKGVTITNRNPRGYGLWLEGTSPRITSNSFRGNTQDGILILGKSSALVSKNIFTLNGANGMSIEGGAQPDINANRFENTGYGMIVRQDAAPRIIANVLINNRSGIIIQPNSSPILRGNIIERNRQTGITILANTFPDLGTVSSAGNNLIRNNWQKDVQYTGAGAIAAVGNQILQISGNLQLSGEISGQTSQITLVPSIPISRLPNNSNNSSNSITRTIIPNSVIVRTLPIESTKPLPANTAIDPSLPPIALRPPTGAPVNQTIIITRAKPTPSVSLRYRVVVAANSESSKLEVRRLVPTAFTARFNGQEVIQVGAFSDRTAADEQVKKLAQAGINAAIEPIASP